MTDKNKAYTLTVGNRGDIKDGHCLVGSDVLLTVNGVELVVNSIDIKEITVDGIVTAVVELPIKFK